MANSGNRRTIEGMSQTTHEGGKQARVHIGKEVGRLVSNGSDARGEDALGVSSCPLCLSISTFESQVIWAGPLIAEWRQLFGIDIEPELRDVPSIRLRVCRHCNLQYFQPSRLAGSPSLYAQLGKMDWYYLPQKWEHDVALEDLRHSRKILEIGCGSGKFIVRASQGPGRIVQGLEGNPDAVERARQRGVQVFVRDLQEFAEESRAQYDAVCSFQVLEHVPCPRDFLDSCLALLSRGGKLLLGLPNSESFLRYQSSVLDMPPHHMTRWSPRVVKELPKLFPLRLEAIRLEPLAPYHVGPYLDAHFSRIRPRALAHALRKPGLLSLLQPLVRISGISRFLLGQTLYVSLTRI